MADTKSPEDSLNSILDEANKRDNQPAVDDIKPVEAVEPEPKTQETEEQVFEVGGRKFHDEEDLRKWGNSLQRDYTKKTQRLSELEKEYDSFKKENEQAIELAKALKDNPKFQDEVLGVWEKHVKLIQQGSSPAQAARKSGLNDLPPEVQRAVKIAEQFEQRMQAQQEEQDQEALLQEIAELKKAVPGLTDKHVDSVLREALKWNGRVIDPETGEPDPDDEGIALIDVYKMMNAKTAWKKAEKAKDTGVGSVKSEYVAPENPKPSHEDTLKAILKNAGY